MSAVLLIDKNKVRRSFASAVDSYDELATLQRKVGLQLMRQFFLQNGCEQVVDIGCGTGFLTQQLIDQASVSQVVALDIAWSMVQRTRVKLEASDSVYYICADAERIPLKKQSADMIVSNLALQWCQNLTAVFDGFKKTLKPAGGLLFSTFGPATLQELRLAWAKADDYDHVNGFYSTDDLQEFLVQAGFKNIMMETKIYQSSYQSVVELMRELKGIGAHNMLAGRNRRVTSKSNMQTMISAYEKDRVNGGISATYEIIFVTARAE